MTTIDRERLLARFLRLAEVDSPSRGEGPLARLVAEELTRLGWQVADDHTGTDCGNLIAALPGDAAREPLLFASHLDVVMPCLGVRPRVTDGFVTSAGDTVLGADAKASVAALLEVAAVLSTRPPASRPPIEFVFTWAEEVGHLGAKALDLSRLQARRAWVLDGLVPVGTIILAAPTYYSFAVGVRGRAAHAGVEPERGISAIAVAAEAISRLTWGRLDASTTANIGTIRGGSARNAVPAEVHITAEVRSLSGSRAAYVANHIATTFRSVVDAAGAQLDLEMREEYAGYTLPEDDPVVVRAREAFVALGAGPAELVTSGGGSDANEFNARGLRACVLGIGAENCHSVSERIHVDQLELLARWVVQMVEPTSRTPGVEPC